MFSTGFPRLVGVIHLPALPGSPRAELSMTAIAESAARDAAILADAGFEAIVLENFGDAPFFKDNVPAVTVAAMTACALAVRSAAGNIPVGVNVLRNDGVAALSIAVATGCAFVRVNVLTGARVTDQGVLEGRAAELLRLRRALGADGVALFADVAVKHSAPLGERPLAAEVKDTLARALADAVLVTGEGTGEAVDLERLATVRRAASGAPVYVASGASRESLPTLARACHGVIVGSALRPGDRAGVPVDADRARAFADAFRRAFGSVAPRS